ncbi:MerR family transcriptional regulator [Paenibacillus mucilaginosus]|uniref:Transcriptional regulator n=1 Tax=Paenibacillus mucilaginosus (strain KNP414) TaxID=1036673 RepID=F8F8Q2_PAEMK|nr:MerR family transcriptional regulator [Paenibacillus mucilaginosus]AEI41964.1 transcriptional regulator [Paenibacillus mucilaginosus KNP414]MCG7217850.1 MerR family transcriptional regulator [Paenibacillus mucilaginosus]WDM28870.1 MerR family transcriptional regulator [Paenibacillus mucilaginosus]WFA17046.1 MerR family transcriptional regulator [Paenibacillus mucilaginosus]
MFKISDFSKLSRVSVKTLRYYDQIGLLRPAHTDGDSGYRYYTADQLYRLHRILAFKDLGFTLEQIGPILEEVSCEEINGMLRLKQAELQQKVLEEQARLARIEARVQQIRLEEGKAPVSEPVVKRIDAELAATLRAQVPRSHLGQLAAEAQRHVQGQGMAPGPLVVQWHDCGLPDGRVDIEVGVLLGRPIRDDGRFRVTRLPEMPLVASFLHRCDPRGVCRASSQLAQWIERNGYRIADEPPQRELFYPAAEGEDPGALRHAELLIPVVPNGSKTD